MSSALVRQALEFIDPDVTKGKKKKRGTKRQPGGQDLKQSSNNSKAGGVTKEKKEKLSEEVIKQLLELSKPTADKTLTDKIVRRAVKGKPLIEKEKVKKEEQKSILFAEEDFDTFEEELFCS